MLIGIVDSEIEAEVLLARRANHLRLHAGEIAFPGGKREPRDASLWETALREAEEETLLSPSRVKPLGHLSTVLTRTGIQITPCVGLVSDSSGLQPNPAELDEIFQVPVAFFGKRDTLRFERFNYGGKQRNVPCYQWQQHRIWGVTAAMLAMLANAALDADIDLEPYWHGRDSG